MRESSEEEEEASLFESVVIKDTHKVMHKSQFQVFDEDPDALRRQKQAYIKNRKALFSSPDGSSSGDEVLRGEGDLSPR